MTRKQPGSWLGAVDRWRCIRGTLRSAIQTLSIILVASLGCTTEPTSVFQGQLHISGLLKFSLTIGANHQLSLVSVGPNGVQTPVTGTWASSDPKVVVVDEKGLARAVGHGRATITATSGSRTARTIVETHPATVRLRLASGGTGVEVGKSHEIIAEFLDAEGEVVEVSSHMTWSASGVPAIDVYETSGISRATIRPMFAGEIEVVVRSFGLVNESDSQPGPAAMLRLTAWSLSDTRYPVLAINEYSMLYTSAPGARYFAPDIAVTSLVNMTITQVVFAGHTSACAAVPLEGGQKTFLFDFQPYDFGWAVESVPERMAPIARVSAVLEDGRRVTAEASGPLVDLIGIQDRGTPTFGWYEC